MLCHLAYCLITICSARLLMLAFNKIVSEILLIISVHSKLDVVNFTVSGLSVAWSLL